VNRADLLGVKRFVVRATRMHLLGRRAVWAGVVFLIAAGGGIAFAAVPDSGSVYHCAS
jgi:hypothetical protein